MLTQGWLVGQLLLKKLIDNAILYPAMLTSLSLAKTGADNATMLFRVRRDIMHRGRDVLQVLDQYERTVKPSFESYILPTKKEADIIVSSAVGFSCTSIVML